MSDGFKCLAYDPSDLKTCLLAACPDGHVNVLHPDNSVSCVKIEPDQLCGGSPCPSSSCVLFKGIPTGTNKVCLIDDSELSCGVGEVPVLEIMKATGHARVVCRREVDELEHPTTAARLPEPDLGCSSEPLPAPVFEMSTSGGFEEDGAGEGDGDDGDDDSEGGLDSDDHGGFIQEPMGSVERIVLVVTQPQHESVVPPSTSQANLSMIYYGGTTETMA
jgi:hypothetical protein